MAEQAPIDLFEGQSVCPNCAAIAPVGTAKCPECGTFHITIQDDERDDIDDVEPLPLPDKESRDPGFYSINPRESIPIEHFESDEDAVTDWKGSSIDFGLEDEE